MDNKGLRFVLDGEFATGAELVRRVNVFVGSPFELLPANGAVVAEANKIVASSLSAVQTPVPQNAPSLFPALPDSDDLPPPPGTAIPATDARGVPWDERVHSSAKSINQDGTWKKRKGVAPATVAKIEAELTAPTGNQTVSSAPNAGIPVMPAPVAPAPIAPAPVMQEVAPTDFVSLIRWTAKHSATPSNPAGKLEQKMVDDICKHYGMVSIQDVAAKPEFVPYIYQYLTQSIGEPYLPGHVELK